VREFVASQPEVVFKPALGGSLCRPVDAAVLQQLDQIRAAPVTFQERIQGTPVRLTLVDGEPVSCVKLLSDHLDYRNDPEYEAGRTAYERVKLPDRVLEACVRTIQRYGLIFSGIDLMLTPEGEYVFLEANCSPLYLDIELRAQDPITAEIAVALLRHANDPARYQQALAAGRQTQGFVSYAMPFGNDLWT
jgi:predicted ATP-grasp superfamily ATP-dependent carboligase